MPAYDESRERALLQRICRGDSAALDELYAEFRPRIRRFLARFGCSDAEADVVCNETLFIVWRKASGKRAGSRVSTWILGIARHRMLKLIERRQRDADRHAPLEGTRLTAEGIPESERLELRQWLRIGLDSLPADQRQALELAFVEGLSYQEIAMLVGCPENTVKTRIFHARRRLREILKHHDGKRPLRIVK